MAKRIKSQDRTRDTDDVPGLQGGVSQSGRDSGRLPRDIDTKDELKRASDRPVGATRVTKSDEEEGGF